MEDLIGEYEATVDTKGRFLLPTGLKKQLPEGSNLFVVNRGFERCLTLYPKSTWIATTQKIKALNEFDHKVREFRMYFLGGATEIELDSAGRLLLPQALRDFAEITKDIIMASQFDKIQIWDAGKYKKIIYNTSPEHISMLADEVFKN